MPIDPSIILQAKPTIVNPLETASQALGVRNQLLQNQNTQQTLAARAGIGEAYTKAIDPQSGQLDTNKLMGALASDPRTAWMAGDVAKQAQDRAAQQVQIDQSKVDLAKKQIGTFQNALGGLIARPDISPNDVVSVASDLVSQGILDPKQAVDEVANMPQDPSQIRPWLMQHWLRMQDAKTQMDALVGPVQTTDAGGNVVMTRTPGAGGPMQVVGQIEKGLSPSEAVSPAYQVYNPQTRQMETVTKGMALQGAGGQMGGAGGIAAGPPMGAAAAAEVTARGNAQQAQALQQRAGRVPDNKALLGNLEGRLNDFQPGPQSQFWKSMGQLSQEYGVPIPGAPPKDATAAQEEFGKLAFQLAQSQFQALGGTGTDSKLDSTMHTSPSEMLSRYGNKGIISMLKGNEDAIQAQNDAWQKWQDAGNGAESYGKFLSQWNKIYDPRVFQSRYLDAAGAKQMMQGMTASEKAKFQQDQALARRLGWVQ